MKVFVCEDSIDGIFSAIYDAFVYICNSQDEAKIQVNSITAGYYEQELFCEYEELAVDYAKAAKVADAIKKKISHSIYTTVVHAALSYYADKGNTIFQFLRLGFKYGAKIMSNLTNEYVMAMFEMDRNVCNEEHLFTGFLRFTEITEQTGFGIQPKKKVLLARYEPKNNLTPLIATHFVNRLHEENFVIFDAKRGLAALYEVGHPWLLAGLTEEVIKKYTELSENELEYQKLWLTFFKSIGVEARENYKLQRNNLNLRYRKYMTEFINQA